MYGIEVAGGNARFEDEVAVRIGYTEAVIYYDEMPVAAVLEGRGYIDGVRACVAGVTQELVERVLDGAKVTRAAPGAFDAGEAGEAGA